ncbi:MAG: Gfo/Idh/MocA family oxidoreductase [Candidatus Latescibacteria bacterium]|nr:Gfo/Idh/MocA family oxidoreductase [Candidatus Latescibacterota bacterium]MBT5829480.1 Gfo/Idh/MocA family oxidoreductase [Candidatus Latescibacterota bacterium]
MMTQKSRYRSLLLGCGSRAGAHAKVYPDIPAVDLVAVCDWDAVRRERFMAHHGIVDGFDDYEAALREVRPDIVHVVTPPTQRVREVELAVEAGVRAVILEKPIALRPSEIVQLNALHTSSGVEIITNAQRRYFPEARDGVLSDILQSKLGQLYCIRCSTKGNQMGMGPHLMDWLMQLLNEAQPQSVWAMAYGVCEEGYQATHLAPEHLFAQYWFSDGLRVFFDCDPDALGTPEDVKGFNLHYDFLGTKGRLYLTQNGDYWYQSHDMSEPHFHKSSDTNQDVGQRDLTLAVAEWLDNGTPHLNRYRVGRAVVDALFAAQQSAYEGRRIELPHTFTDNQWMALRNRSVNS